MNTRDDGVAVLTADVLAVPVAGILWCGTCRAPELECREVDCLRLIVFVHI